MAVINYKIPESNLEVIRDQIAVLLKDELDNQAELYDDDATLTGAVFIERFTPIDKSEGTVLNVYIDRGNFTDQTQVTQRGKFNFNIDIYVWDVDIGTEEGYYRSARKLHRIANLVHNIIQNPLYKTLGLDPGVIYNRTCQSQQYDQPANNADTNFSRFGRVVLTVDFHCQQPHEVAITASGYDTKWKIDLTDKGYQVITNN